MKTLALLVLYAAALLHAHDYFLGTDAQPKDGIPKGTVTRLKLEPGKLLRSLNNSVRVPVVASSDLLPVGGIFVDLARCPRFPIQRRRVG
jgi:hypothetical protein